MRTRNWMWIGGLILAVAAMPAMAQNAGGDGGGSKGGKTRGGGNWDPAAFRARINEQIKTQLGATDEEWKVLLPKIEKVQTAALQARLGGMVGGGRGPGGTAGGGTATDRPQTPIAKATSELRSALEDKSIGAEEIANRLKALRDAKQKAKEEYEAAQKDLKEVLTQRQEATLVMSGVLE